MSESHADIKPCDQCREGQHSKCTGDFVPSLYCGCLACNTTPLFGTPPTGAPWDQAHNDGEVPS